MRHCITARTSAKLAAVFSTGKRDTISAFVVVVGDAAARGDTGGGDPMELVDSGDRCAICCCTSASSLSMELACMRAVVRHVTCMITCVKAVI